MTTRNTIARSMHDVGLAAWFGGSLMGAVALNGAASDLRDPHDRLHVANSGWARWTPVNLAAIGVHLVGATQLAYANKGRVLMQKGVMTSTVAKAGLTAAALGVTAYSRALGEKTMKADGAPAAGATEPSAATPEDVARAQRRLQALQWAIPALTGSIVVMNAVHGEQQRTSQVTKGVLARATTQLVPTVAAGVAAGKLLATRAKVKVGMGAAKRAPGAVALAEGAKWATHTARHTTRGARRTASRVKHMTH